MQEKTAGDRYPITPSSEYFAVHIVDESFNVVGFASNFQARDIRQFPHTPLRYGAITLDDERPPIVDEIILTSYDMNTKVPFFLVDFSDLGWQIGAQAIAKAAEMHPDLVFIDIKLEGEINGIEATKHIRSSLDIPTIYLADYSNRIHLYRIQGIIVVFSLSRGYLRVSPLWSNKGYRDVYAKIL